MLKLEIRRERGYKICRSSVKAEEDRKEAKEAAVLSNVPTADRWCRGTKPRNPLAACHLLNLSWPRSLDKKALSYLLGLTQNTTASHAPCTAESSRFALKTSGIQGTEKDTRQPRLFFSLIPYTRTMLSVSP